AVVRVRVRSADRADELEGRGGHPPGGREPEGVGRQPYASGREGAGRTDVRVGDVPASRAFGGRSRQPDAAVVRQPAPPASKAARGVNETLQVWRMRWDSAAPTSNRPSPRAYRARLAG